jgi:hypothetical protein
MNRNIFMELSNYPYNPIKNPRENQHTICFCHLLNTENELLPYILKSLVKSKSKIIKRLGSTDYEKISPFSLEYINYRPQYPDMKIIDKNKKLTIFVENKIDSLEGRYPGSDYDDQNTQIKKYLTLAKKCPTNEKLVLYITKHDEELDEKIQNHPNFAGQHTWHEVSNIIERNIYKYKLDKGSLVHQFLDYMEDKDLKGTKGYEKDYASIWREYIMFNDITKEYLDEVADNFKKKGYRIRAEKPGWGNWRFIYRDSWSTKNLDGFWIKVGFWPTEDEEKPSEYFIAVFAELGERRMFYEFLNSNKNEELQNGLAEIRKLKFSESEDWPGFYWKYKPLEKIRNNYYGLPKNKQKLAVIAWLNKAVDQIDNSNLSKLLKREYVDYRKNKSR